MIDFDVTDLLLGVVSVLVALSTFMNARRKDCRNAGAQEATFHADLKYIKELLQDVRSEMKELTKSIDQHAERIATCEAQIVSAFKSIQRIESQLAIQKEE
jgi:peptidoglycan hydrolase CwlO-like protein